MKIRQLNNHIYLDEYIVIPGKYEEKEFKDAIKDIILSGKDEILISYCSDINLMTTLHVDSIAIDAIANSPTAYIIGTVKDFKLVKKHLQKILKNNYLLRIYRGDNVDLIHMNAGKPALKKMVNADLLLEVTYGPTGGYTVWELFNNSVFCTGVKK